MRDESALMAKSSSRDRSSSFSWLSVEKSWWMESCLRKLILDCAGTDAWILRNA